MTMFKSLPENEADIQAVKDILTALPSGQVMLYTEATTAIGRDVRAKARHILNAAIKAAEAEIGTRYACVPMVGIKRIPVEEVPALGTSYLSRIRRAAQRGIRRLSGVRDNAPPDVQQRINAQAAQLGALALVARNESTKKIEAQSTPSHRLPIGRTLELFMDKQD